LVRCTLVCVVCVVRGALYLGAWCVSHCLAFVVWCVWCGLEWCVQRTVMCGVCGVDWSGVCSALSVMCGACHVLLWCR
jgi:hypothetical protein